MPTDPADIAASLTVRLANGFAVITQLPYEQGFVWEATGADGTSGQGEEPYGSQDEATTHARAFLTRHTSAHGHDAAHAKCIEPHRDTNGEHVDCDGKPL